MIGSVLKILGSALSIWEHESKTKYQEKYYRVKKEYDEEMQKPDNQVIDSRVDDLRDELLRLSDLVATKINSSNS